MTVHEFFKCSADSVAETSFVKTILHMLAYPLEKCLAKNLQFLSANGSRLSGEPLQLRWCQTLRDRRVNLIGFLIPKWMCLVAVGHLVDCLVSLLFSAGPVDRASAYAQPDKATETPRPPRYCPQRSKSKGVFYFSCFILFPIN
jgi:hypothetical protein